LKQRKILGGKQQHYKTLISVGLKRKL